MSSGLSVPSLANADCRASTGCVTVDAPGTAAGPVPSVVALAAALADFASIFSAADTAPRILLRIGRTACPIACPTTGNPTAAATLTAAVSGCAADCSPATAAPVGMLRVAMAGSGAAATLPPTPG